MKPAIRFEKHSGPSPITGHTFLVDVGRMIGGAAWSATCFATREAYQYVKKCHWWL